jgi:probable rRNA maturation factor
MSPPLPSAADIRNLQRTETIDRSVIERAAAEALRAGGAPGKRVSVVIVSDRGMARLNRRFLGKTGPTDVLAFDIDEGDLLGEVVVSATACRRQADERGARFEEELALLTAHGVLHLAGHDHTLGARQDRAMRALEGRVMKKLGMRP